jgi:hypothetical protein
MRKKERVYREILHRFYELGVFRLGLREIASSCRVSPGLASHTLKPLQQMGAIRMYRRWFEVVDAWKILLFWCNVRRLWADVVYLNRVELPVEKIEGIVPPKAVFTAYTGFKHRFGYVPADYGEVVVYGVAEEFEERFGEARHTEHPNLIVLKIDEHLLKFTKTPLAQIYVDLWNLGTWYAREFIAKLEKHLQQLTATGSSRGILA